MKKIFFKSMLLLCALIVGTNSVWGDTAEFSYSDFSGQGSSGSGSSLDGALINGIFINGKGNGNTNYLQIYANNYLTITSTNGATISSIVLTATSNTYIKTWSASDKSTVSISNATATWSGSSTSAITLTNTASAQARLTSITVTYVASSGGSTPTTTTITPAITNTELANGTTAGSFSAGVTMTSSGNPVPGATVTWSSSKPSVAIVGETTGLVTLVAAGTTTISATYAGDATYSSSYATYDLTVTDTRTETTTEINIPDGFNTELTTSTTAGTLTSIVKVSEAALDPQPSITWSSSKTTVATINENTGAVTLVAKGTTTITANYTGNNTYKSSFATYELTVTNTHNGIFYVNGIPVSTVPTNQGSNIAFPSNPEDQGEMLFVGWSSTEIDGSTTETPSLVNSKQMGSTQDIPFYAVFASNVTIVNTDVLTRETTGVTKGSTSYTNWSNKKSNSEAVYAGNSAGGNDAIQLRSTNNSGIVTTASGGIARKVSVEWESNTADERTLDIYCKKSAYSAASELYNNENKGTKVGSITNGTSTEATIAGDFYDYIGVRSNSGAMYLTSVSIQWVDYSDANYFTTIPLNVSGTISPAGWSSFSSTFPLDLSTISGGTAYVASEASGSVVTLAPCTNVVAANTGLMVKGTPNAEFTINVSSAALTTPSATNLLKGQATTSNVAASGTDGKYHYIFGYQTSDHSICGFYNLTAPTPVSAGKAYLETTTALTVPQTGAPAIIRILDEENNATSIEAIGSEDKAVKFMENGQIYILREGVVYDALGRKVR